MVLKAGDIVAFDKCDEGQLKVQTVGSVVVVFTTRTGRVTFPRVSVERMMQTQEMKVV